MNAITKYLRMLAIWAPISLGATVLAADKNPAHNPSEAQFGKECTLIDDKLATFKSIDASPPCKTEACDTYSAWIDNQRMPRKIRYVHETFKHGTNGTGKDVDEELFYFDSVGNLICNYSKINDYDPEADPEACCGVTEGKRHFGERRMLAWISGTDWQTSENSAWTEVQNETLTQASKAYAKIVEKIKSSH